MSEDPGPIGSGSRASDVLVFGTAAAAVAAWALPSPGSDVAVAVLAVALITWPLGFFVFLARRWARIGDWRFVGMTALLTVTAVLATSVGIQLSG
jgi:hypothetical protein